MLLSDVCLVCLSVAYIGHNSRTKRPRKTKIGTEVAHVTRNSDTTFKVRRSKVSKNCIACAHILLCFALLCFDSIGTNLVKLRNAYFFRVVVCFSEFSGKLPVFIFTADCGKTLQEAGHIVSPRAQLVMHCSVCIQLFLCLGFLFNITVCVVYLWTLVV